MTRRSGLGRGLGSLIPHDLEGEPQAPYRELPIELIDPNPYQPRRHFDEEAIDALTASITELGVLQPVLVRPVEDRYELIAGERRWRSAARAGLATIPALVREVDDPTSLAEALVENLHRQELNPLEEAAAYRQLLEDFELRHEDLARRVGRSRTAVTNTLRLLQLPAAVQRRLVDGELSAGHARALLGLSDRLAQEHLAMRIVDEGLSVRAVEDLIRAERELEATSPTTGDDAPAGEATPPSAAPSAPSADQIGATRPPGVLELEELLAERLATSVAVKLGGGGRRGRVIVDFADIGDLERIARLLLGAGETVVEER